MGKWKFLYAGGTDGRANGMCDPHRIGRPVISKPSTYGLTHIDHRRTGQVHI